jgi:hypothetical protein
MIDFLTTLALPRWLLASVVLYLAGTNLSWRLQSWTEGHGQRIGHLARRLPGSPPSAIASFAFNVGVPYTVLLLGRFDPRQAGLIGLDWLRSGAIAAGLTLAVAAFLWFDGKRAQAALQDAAQPVVVQRSPVAMLWRAVFQQSHLGFYRVVLLTVLAPYTAALLALALVVGEWALNPAWRAAWLEPALPRTLAFDLALLLTTTVLFLYTGNFWVCLAAHAALTVMMSVRYRDVINAPIP